MRVPAKLVGLNGVDYQRHVQDIVNDREIWRCIMSLDVSGFRKAAYIRAPHLPQPESDWEALHIMHLSRVRMLHISPQQKRYSEHWLRELSGKTRIAAAVGIAVKAFKRENKERAADVQAAMSEAVLQAVKDGVDIELDVPEVHRRMKLAKIKVHGNTR